MKLQTKIFIGILMVSLTTLSISSYYLINQTHLDNITREQERSLNEFSFLYGSMENGVDLQSSETNLRLLFSHYSEYYLKKEIHLLVYRNHDLFYSDFNDVKQASYDPLLSVPRGTRMIQILQESQKHYIFISEKFNNQSDFVLVYARDISYIYRLRTQSICLSLLLAGFLILLVGFLSYLYSRWLTKPIEKLNQGARSISEGNYSVRIPDTKDEFQSVGGAFNRMASAVEARTGELEARAKELQTFIDDLSHEMNTPMTSIQGYSEFLVHANASTEQKQKAAETIQTEAKRMKDIYTKLMLLTFARENEPELSAIKIDLLFQEIKDNFALLMNEHNISLEITNQLDTLLIDHTLFFILLSNLVKNSIQSLPNGGMIQLCAYTKDNTSILEVRDNGYGIPKEKISEVTKPFYRVDKSRSRKTGGAGLGLSICKRIAELHHVTLQIESEEGTGTSMKIIFYNSDTTLL